MKHLFLIWAISMSTWASSQTINWQILGQQNAGASCFAWNGAKTKLYKGTYFSGVHMSLDSGVTWQSLYPGIIGGVYSIAVKNDTLFAEFSGCSIGGVRYTPNDGLNWYRIDNGPNAIPVTYEIAANSLSIFVAAYDNICKTDNNGATWQLLSTPHLTGGSYTMALDGSIVASAGNGKVYVSYDNGSNWTTHNIPSALFTFGWGMFVEGNKIYMGTPQGLMKSTDFGFTWTNLGIPNENLMAIKFFGQYGFVASANNQNMLSNVYFSSNGGNTWVLANNGLPPNPEILDFTFIDNKVIAGGWGSGMWFTNLSLTGIDENETAHKNISVFPNPANEFIAIEMSPMNQDSKAHVYIDDILGNRLITSEYNNFSTSLRIDVSDLRSGVYIVTVSNENTSLTEKIIIY